MQSECPYCEVTFPTPKDVMKHMLGCFRGEGKKKQVWSIFDEGCIEDTDFIADEIALVESCFEDVLIETQGSFPQLTFDMRSGDGDIRILLRISIVYGYPYVAPRVEIEQMPARRPLGSTSARNILQTVRDNVSPGLLVGVPCIQQIVLLVQQGIDALADGESGRTDSGNLTGSPLSRQATEGTIGTLTKQSVFILHLLMKLCGSEFPDEWDSMFVSARDYIMREVGLLNADAVNSFTSATVRSYFKSHIDSAKDNESIMSWLWSAPQETEDSKAEQQQAVVGHSRYRDQFVQLKKLGEGGFAPVFECRKKVDGRVYAIKRVLIKTKDAARALREVRTLATLDHLNIVRYYDAWLEEPFGEDIPDDDDDDDEEDTESESSAEYADYRGAQQRPSDDVLQFFDGAEDAYDNDDNGYDEMDSDLPQERNSTEDEDLAISGSKYHVLFIQMELCHPKTLKDAIMNGDIANEDTMARILRQLLNVIEYVHGKKMMHRDLKPANVLFEDAQTGFNGNIKVADFGLARQVDIPKLGSIASIASMGDIDIDALDANADLVTRGCGTVLYCAPEQLDGKQQYGMTVDEYSIGMIAYEMWLCAAGKDYRERFDAMARVKEEGCVPKWFEEWRPKVAGIINHLFVLDYTKRKSAQEVLALADMPGEPAEISTAIEVFARHADRMMPRMMHHAKTRYLNQDSSVNSRRASTVVPEIERSACRTLQRLADLRNAAPSTTVWAAVPHTHSTEKLGCPTAGDQAGRFLALPETPFLPLAYHACQGKGTQLDTAFTYIHSSTTALRTTFAFCRTSPRSIWNDIECALLVHQVGSFLCPTETDLVVGHGALFDILAESKVIDEAVKRMAPRREVSSRKDLDDLFSYVKVAAGDAKAKLLDEVREQLYPIVDSLLQLDSQKYPSLDRVRIIFDCLLRPVDPSAAAYVAGGAIFELRTRDDSNSLIAHGCHVDPLLGAFNLEDSLHPLTTAVFHVDQLHLQVEKWDFATHSTGVAVVPQRPPHGVCNEETIVATALSCAQLWLSGIRSQARFADTAAATIQKQSAAQQLHFMLSVSSDVIKVSKLSGKAFRTEVSSDEVGSTMKGLLPNQSGGDTTSAKVVKEPNVSFVSKVESNAVRAAKDAFHDLTYPPPTTIVAAAMSLKEIRESISQMGNSDTPKAKRTAPQLQDYLHRMGPNVGAVPIFSTVDGSCEFFVNHGKALAKARRKDPKRGIGRRQKDVADD